MRERIIQLALLFSVVIHAMPASGFIGAAMLEKLYGVNLNDPNLVILMQHRAWLFGVIALISLIAIRFETWRNAALTLSLLSAGGFILTLLLADQTHNAKLQTVLVVDSVLLVAVVIGAALHGFTLQRERAGDATPH